MLSKQDSPGLNEFFSANIVHEVAVHINQPILYRTVKAITQRGQDARPHTRTHTS